MKKCFFFNFTSVVKKSSRHLWHFEAAGNWPLSGGPGRFVGLSLCVHCRQSLLGLQVHCLEAKQMKTCKCAFTKYKKRACLEFSFVPLRFVSSPGVHALHDDLILFAFHHVIGEHGMKVWNRSSKDYSVSTEFVLSYLHKHRQTHKSWSEIISQTHNVLV